MHATKVIINLKPDGSVRGIVADYAEMDGERERPVGTKRLRAEDVEPLMPGAAAALAQIGDLLAKLEAETRAREAAEKARDEAFADRDRKVSEAETDRDRGISAAEADRDQKIAAAESERDATVAAKEAERAAEAARADAEAAKVAALEARIAELTAVPDRSIHKAYLRAALASIERLSEADAAVQAAGAVKWELWANATTISQDDLDVNAIAAALGIDLDAVFAAARAIRAARGG